MDGGEERADWVAQSCFEEEGGRCVPFSPLQPRPQHPIRTLHTRPCRSNSCIPSSSPSSPSSRPRSSAASTPRLVLSPCQRGQLGLGGGTHGGQRGGEGDKQSPALPTHRCPSPPQVRPTVVRRACCVRRAPREAGLRGAGGVAAARAEDQRAWGGARAPSAPAAPPLSSPSRARARQHAPAPRAPLLSLVHAHTRTTCLARHAGRLPRCRVDERASVSVPSPPPLLPPSPAHVAYATSPGKRSASHFCTSESTYPNGPGPPL